MANISRNTACHYMKLIRVYCCIPTEELFNVIRCHV